MPETHSDPFLFAEQLKIISPNLTDEQKQQLRDWNALNLAYQADVQSFNLNPSQETARQTLTSIGTLGEKEAVLNELLNTIYLELPDPNAARNLWDAGAEREKREAHLEALEALKQYTKTVYIQSKTDAKRIADYLQQGTKPDDPVSGGTPVETTLNLINNTTFALSLKATIADPSQWGDAKNRPDNTIKGEEGGPLILKPFAVAGLREDVADGASTADFEVSVTVEIVDEENDRRAIEQFTFKANQYLAISPPTLEKEGLSPDGLPVVYKPIETSSKYYWVIQEFADKSSGKKALTLAISEKREGLS